ncbi:MAG TPA: hypothetical protein VFA10_12625 [Ktedonobacteraceae bacterium]|nr:hypothetical protein [Ktedonobacteraceae bacterium]
MVGAVFITPARLATGRLEQAWYRGGSGLAGLMNAAPTTGSFSLHYSIAHPRI